MWKCPICKTDNQENRICANCGFDESANYLRYKTLGQIPKDVAQSFKWNVKKYDKDKEKTPRDKINTEIRTKLREVSGADRYILFMYVLVSFGWLLTFLTMCEPWRYGIDFNTLLYFLLCLLVLGLGIRGARMLVLKKYQYTYGIALIIMGLAVGGIGSEKCIRNIKLLSIAMFRRDNQLLVRMANRLFDVAWGFEEITMQAILTSVVGLVICILTRARMKTLEKVQRENVEHNKKEKYVKKNNRKESFTYLNRVDKNIVLLYAVNALIWIIKAVIDIASGVNVFFDTLPYWIMVFAGVYVSVAGIRAILSKRYYIRFGVGISLTSVMMIIFTQCYYYIAYIYANEWHATRMLIRSYIFFACLLAIEVAICILTRKQAKQYEQE